MKRNQDNPSITIALTEGQKRKIRDWSGCVVYAVLVSAYPDSSGVPEGSTISARNIVPIKLEPHQIKTIKEGFSEYKLTGEEIMVSDPHDEEGDEEPIIATAVLKKNVPLPKPASVPKLESFPVPKPKTSPKSSVIVTERHTEPNYSNTCSSCSLD